MKPILAALALSAVLLVPIHTAPAHAATWCVYAGHNPFSNQWDNGISGSASGIFKKRVCNRAKNRCLRKLRHAWKHGRGNGFRCERASVS